MSLSQKHSGKVLVPWFNIAEWKAVYNLLYGDVSQNWDKALDILHIWKLRTPLLSAGVEGTLIILEALLSNKHKLSSYEITHIFATSLIRFLNLCAASNDKQGTFYKTAKENELPNWLINIRHDIAHSHNVPSQSMLELSLKFCLNWLKGKYWDVQHEQMLDFVVDDAKGRNLGDLFEKTESKKSPEDDELLQSIYEFFKSNPEEAANKLFSCLTNQGSVFTVHCETDLLGRKQIPHSLTKWNKLLDMIHEAEVLPKFVDKLFSFICDGTKDSSYREAASLWMKEIFQGLINKENNSEDSNVIQFTFKNNCMKNRNFVLKVLNSPTPYTLHFIKEVLEYNDAPSQFIEDSVSLISAFNTSAQIRTDKIFTADDLNLNSSEIEPITVESQLSSRWILIEDTSSYMNLPLGVLPHQNRNVNPLLDL